MSQRRVLDEKKSLAVGRDVERFRIRCEALRIEQHSRRAGAEARLGTDIYRHEVPLAPVEELTSVERPHRGRAAVGGDSPLVTHIGIGLHLNFVSARLVRDVGEVATVRGKTGLPLVVRRCDEDTGLSPSTTPTYTSVLQIVSSTGLAMFG